MKIVVLNGSPKGEVSVTLQYVKYLQKMHPNHEYQVFHIAQGIRRLEKDGAAFNAVIEAIKASDGIIWDFPLYVMMVHANYKRFIELIAERGVQGAFEGKGAIQVATSINFFDHTALNYMELTCVDLKMNYIGAYSAEMNDLLKDVERKRFEHFCHYFFHRLKLAETGGFVSTQLMLEASQKPSQNPSKDPKVAVVSDADEQNITLRGLINKFTSSVGVEPKVFELATLDLKGSCLGCLKCGKDNKCVYEGKDDVIGIYKELQSYDIIIYAVQIKDHYFSARWKTYVDRRFFRTHQPQLEGKQLLYLIDGDLSANTNLEQMMRSLAELDECNLVGAYSTHVRGERHTDVEENQALNLLADKVMFDLKAQYVAPKTFLGKGGIKLFRDEIWGRLRFVFMADHRFYKKHGYYDFPQKEWKVRLLNVFGPLIRSIPSVEQKIVNNMPAMMVKNYERVLK